MKQKQIKAITTISLVLNNILLINFILTTVETRGFEYKAHIIGEVARATEVKDESFNEEEAQHNGDLSQLKTVTKSDLDKTAEVSAYTSRPEETDSSPCISADNTNICEYEGCAVATNDYPNGTWLEIKGFGKCLVKDKMIAIWSMLIKSPRDFPRFNVPVIKLRPFDNPCIIIRHVCPPIHL